MDRAAHLAQIESQGYTLIEDVLTTGEADALAEDLTRIEREIGTKPGYNPFEGDKTLRVYNLLVYGKIWEAIPQHPTVLPVVEGVLDKGCLVSSLSSVKILPGETPQPLHGDDQLMPVARPHPALVCNTMWALTDFTEENGATRVVPGSHKFDHFPDPTKHHDTVPAEMKKGSVLVWNGSLWHGGGANQTDQPRVGIPMNYCAGWIRQQENQQLGIPKDIAKGFSPRLRQLVGYGVYNNLMGHIDKNTPEYLLGDSDGELQTVWEGTRKP